MFRPASSHVAAMALLFHAGVVAAAEPCASSYLAPGFCDRNGDLVADPPDDKSQWLNPDTIVLAESPTADMASNSDRMDGFLRHMEKVVGRKFVLFFARDNVELLATLKANRIHVANLNTGSFERAVRCNGFVPVVRMSDESGAPLGTRMNIIVPAKSQIKAVSDLKGRKLTFVDEQSFSGYHAPRALLAKESGMEAGKDYSFDFSGRQDNSILGVVTGLYEAAAVASDILERHVQDKAVSSSSYRTIYRSPNFPIGSWGVSNRLNPEISEKIQRGFLSYRGPTKALYSAGRFSPPDYKNEWAVMREMAATTPTGRQCN